MKCYRCQTQLSPGDSTCRSCGQAVYTTHAGAGLAMGRRIDGALPDRPSARDFRAAANIGSLPRSADLRRHCTPVEDQGQVGSCVTCAIVGAMEYQLHKDTNRAVDLSRMFVYFNARRTRGTQHVDSGSSVSEGMAAFMAFGAPPERAWPYDPTLIAQTPSDDAYAQAQQHVPAEYARVDGADGIRGALAREYPVAFATWLPTRCYEEAGRTGTFPMPTPTEVESTKREGGHSMLLVGYDLDSGVYLVRNSWGADWGDRGYCRMPFDVFAAAADVQSTWILGKLEASGAFTVVRPMPLAKPVEGGVRDMASKMRQDIRDGLTKDIADSFKDIKDRIGRRDR